MAFKRMKGVAGRVYVPEEHGGAKKHRCAEGHFCQWCSDERCRLCLKNKARACTGACSKPGKRPSNRQA